jgi:hypothetical protein
MHTEEAQSQEMPILEADDLVDENGDWLAQVAGADLIMAVRNTTRKFVQIPYAHDFIIPGIAGIGASAATYPLGQKFDKYTDSH